MVYAQPSICPRKWHTESPMRLWYTHGSPNLGQKTRPNNKPKKKENFQNCPLCSLSWPQKNGNCSKRRVSTLTLRGIWKNLWNMKVKIIPIVIGVFDTVTKGLLKGLEDLEVGGRVETIQHYW